MIVLLNKTSDMTIHLTKHAKERLKERTQRNEQRFKKLFKTCVLLWYDRRLSRKQLWVYIWNVFAICDILWFDEYLVVTMYNKENDKQDTT